MTLRAFALVAALSTALVISPADAGRRVIDGTIAACSVEEIFGPVPADGSIEIDIMSSSAGDFPDCGDVANPANQVPFSIKLFGTEYNSVYVNDDGILSFGAPINDDPSTPLLSLGTPAIAPFFGNVLLTSQANLRYGYELSEDSMWLNWLVEEEGGDGSINDFQLAFQQVGTDGDFDLIMNYIGVNWDPGQVGIATGNGGGFLFPGSGVVGGLIGDDNIGSTTPCTVTSIACVIGFGGGQIPSDPNEPGFYRFQFRDGVPINVALVPDIPLPAAFWVFFVGLAGLARLAKRR